MTKEHRVIIESEIESIAGQLGAREPGAIPKLIDYSSLSASESGKVFGTMELVAEFRERYPRLFKSGDPAPRTPHKTTPGDVEDRTRQIINRYRFLFDPSVDPETVVGEMLDLGSLVLPTAQAEKMLIERLTTDSHWSRRFGPGGNPASPDWTDPEVFRAMSPKNPSQEDMRKNRDLLARAGANFKYY